MLPLKFLFAAGLFCISVCLVPSPLFSQNLDTRLSYFCSDIHGSSMLTPGWHGKSASVLNGNSKPYQSGPNLDAQIRRAFVTQISTHGYQETSRLSPGATPFFVAGQSTYGRSLSGSCTKLTSEYNQASQKFTWKQQCVDFKPESRRRDIELGIENMPSMIKSFRGLCTK
jgi:hypothetical protein